jgi:protein O-mannosyl-transferase
MSKKNKKIIGSVSKDRTSQVADFHDESAKKTSIFENKWLTYSILALSILIAYFGAFNNDFVGWDDNAYVYENQDVLKQNWGRLLGAIYEANYHPLTMLTLGINAMISKKAGIFIFSNVLIHILNAILVFVFIKKLTIGNLNVAFFTALFFGIHPMHVESVAWVSERKDVLYTFFFLLSSIYYVKYVQEKTKKFLTLSLLMFLLSCLSKGMAVVLPLVLVLIDYWFDGEIKLKNILSKWHYFAIALLFGIIALDAQSGGNFGGLFIRISEGSAMNQFWSFSDKLLFAGYGFFMYIVKLFVPYNLHHFYAYPYVNEVKGSVFYFLPVLSLLLLVAAVLSYKRSKTLFFAVGFYFVTLVLVLQIIAVGNATMAERYSYLPYVGLIFGILYLVDKNLDFKKLTLVFGLVSVVFMFLTSRQVETWKDTKSLLENSIPHHPDDSYLASSLGTIYAKEGNLDKAIKVCEGPISRGAANYKFYEITGNSYFLKNNLNNAIKYYNDGLVFAKDSLGKNVLYRNLGVTYQKIDQNEALKYFTLAYENKKEVDILKLKGGSYIALGRYQEALNDLNEVYRQGFASDSTFTDMAVAKYELGDRVGAVKDLETALKINPSNQTAKNNLKVLGIN